MSSSLVLSILAALAYVAGGACMKATTADAPGWIAAVWVAFLVGASLQTAAMRGQDLGSSYIVVLGLEAVAAFAVGVWAYGEAVTATRVAGVLLVTAGIALLRA